MDAPIEEPKHLRLLRRLVTVLTVVMILGLLTIVTVIVMQFTRSPGAPRLPTLPPEIALPSSETAQAVTFGNNWVAVVTIDLDGVERIRLFAPDGSGLQSLEIGAAE